MHQSLVIVVTWTSVFFSSKEKMNHTGLEQHEGEGMTGFSF